MHHNGRQDLLSKPVAPICEQVEYKRCCGNCHFAPASWRLGGSAGTVFKTFPAESQWCKVGLAKRILTKAARETESRPMTTERKVKVSW
ncbi:MAG: hypothetical protein JWM21_2673 [Acidobacteria bacterium]|nr:hypothetical protein [Acidobacteriota bacterium]